jgi:hypothetical protein
MSKRPDAFLNVADAMAEDILNTPDDEVLREVDKDYGDPHALANKFDQILERAEKQVFGIALSAASPPVRSSVLGLSVSSSDETIRWAKGIFDLGSRISAFLSSLSPRTLAWSATAAAVAILVQAAVITAVFIKQQAAPSGQSLIAGRKGDRLPMEAVLSQSPPPASSPEVATALAPSSPPAGVGMAADRFSTEVLSKSPMSAEVASVLAPSSPPAAAARADMPLGPMLSDEEAAALIAGGRQLMVAGDIPNARLVLQQAAQAHNAAAALELGATYDPTFLQPDMAAMGDVRMARLWYEKAKDLGSMEAAMRIERLRSVPNPRH